ncbi:MAG: MBL fold metallo-hydrolase [Hyphomicrobiaceae bacterium]
MTDRRQAASGGKTGRVSVTSQTSNAGASRHAEALRYLFEHHPLGADTFEVAPGILWARIPLPFRLNHVNVWLIREHDGWTLIDTGTANAEARAIWEQLLAGVLKGAPIVRLIATHGHTDHVGLASWLHDLAGGVPYHITMVEWLSAAVRIDESRSPIGPHALKFLLGHGCDQITIDSFREERRRTNAQMLPMPTAIERLRDGQILRFGDRNWRVMVCGGHAAEHASFWCEDEGILIAGDQVLSKISPMIGVTASEPNADPLTEYLASLDRFRALPGDPLVLPSHGLPFHGLHARVDQLDHHHQLRLAELEGLMDRPSNGGHSAMHLAHGLFARAVADGQGRHAFSETLAHLHHLVTRGRATRHVDAEGRITFARTSVSIRAGSQAQLEAVSG